MGLETFDFERLQMSDQITDLKCKNFLQLVFILEFLPCSLFLALEFRRDPGVDPPKESCKDCHQRHDQAKNQPH